MTGFKESDPIICEDDIPVFISIDDLLNRYLYEITDIAAVALYKTDGIYSSKFPSFCLYFKLQVYHFYPHLF